MQRIAIALTGLLLFSPLYAEYVYPPQSDSVQRYWKLACEYSDCKDLKAPMVVFGDTGQALGYYYFGTTTVFVTEECFVRTADRTRCEGVLLHEMTHYIMEYTAGVVESCASEQHAWDVYNAYVMNKKRLDLVRENWRESYPLCAKSPNASTSSVTP
jgi:hypothetical protein